jgi:hypothetical protein
LTALLPSLLVVMGWSSMARIDMLALLLAFLGLAVFVVAGRRPLWQYVAFAFFVAALFTRQTLIAAPVACLVTAFIIDRRQAVRLAIFATGLGGSVLGYLAWVTRGEVLRHMFLYNQQNTFSVDRMVRGFVGNVLSILPIAVLAAMSVCVVGLDILKLPEERRWRRVRAWLGRPGVRRLSVVAVLMLVVAVLVAQTYGKTGSDLNYFIEWNLVCCLLVGLIVFRAWNARWCLPAVLLLTYVVPIVSLQHREPLGIRGLWPPSPADQAHVARRALTHDTLLNLIRNTPGPVFSEDMLLLVEAGKEVPAEPAIIRELAMTGLWDETKFISLIHRHLFQLMIIEDVSKPYRYTEAVAAAIDESYLQTQEVAPYEIYQPRLGH